MVILKRVGILSVGKVLGILYAIFGFFFGGILSLFAILGATLSKDGDMLPGALGGIAAVVLLPLLYGVAGFIGGIVMAVLYNIAARMVGGVDLEIQ
jgi:hypothetical protein